MFSVPVSGLSSPGSGPAENIALCSWARHFTLTVSLSTQVYKWIPANLMLGVTLQWTSTPSRGGGGGGEVVTSRYRNQVKLWPDGSLGSYADLPLSFEVINAYNSSMSFIITHKNNGD